MNEQKPSESGKETDLVYAEAQMERQVWNLRDNPATHSKIYLVQKCRVPSI